MMIKITETCTMGCTHCMNRSMPDGRDMSLETLSDTLDFLKKHNIGRHIIITGGEPTEHRIFPAIMGAICGWNIKNKYLQFVAITTNGEKIAEDYHMYQKYIEYFNACGIGLMYQVSADSRYYPRRIPTHKRVFREDGFVLCDNCVEHMYPQGRARDNDLAWSSKASKCFNVRAIPKQIPGASLQMIESMLSAHMKFCTPHIKVDGTIGLGESDLCPAVASIYDTEEEIVDSIINFKCHGCDIINDKLDASLKKFVE